MSRKHSIITLLFFLSSAISFAQGLNEEERKLYDLLMTYRSERGLPEIPLSASLTYVAQTHVQDLVTNKPDLASCNAHSWSSEGSWNSCCYTPDHAQASCMWSKPMELTAYPGNGYEIACGSNDCCSDFVMTAEYALQSWKKSSGHNGVIINQAGQWEDPWNAIGIGLYKGFAVVWFGKETDPE